MPQQVVLATHNPNKVREFDSLLASLPFDLIALSSFTYIAPTETGLTFLENALIKARHASGIAKMPALADDSGLVVPLLDGSPGIHSARYAGEQGNDKANNSLLIERLESTGSPSNRWLAYFVCVLVYVRSPLDPDPLFAHGHWRGRIVPEGVGANGFGYDPHFWVSEFNRTAAEMQPEIKNAHSHRARAVESFVEQYELIHLTSS